MASSTAVRVDGVIYVSPVSTDPECIRRCNGTIITKYCLQEAFRATGIEGSVIHATELGKLVYSKFGYRHIGEMAKCFYKSTQDASKA